MIEGAPEKVLPVIPQVGEVGGLVDRLFNFLVSLWCMMYAIID